MNIPYRFSLARLVAGLIFALVVSSCILACRAESQKLETSAPTGVVLLNDELKHYLDGPRDPLPVLPDPHGSTPISSCREILAVLRSGADLGERMEFPEFAAYSNCLASAVIEDGRVAAGSRFDLNHAGQQIVAHLDLASVRSSLSPRRPGPHYFLADFNFKSVHVEPLLVELISDAFHYRIEVLAAGDFRRSSSTELLVRFIDQATGGSYSSTATLILSWPPKQDAIEATDAVDYLRVPAKGLLINK